MFESGISSNGEFLKSDTLHEDSMRVTWCLLSSHINLIILKK
jgi:hypothetical protein